MYEIINQPKFIFMKSLENKLYIARNIEGEPNTEVLNDLRDFDKEMSQIPEFISLCPQGSTVRGYSVDKSDIDLAILYDSGGIKYNTPEYWEVQKKIAERAQEIKSEIWDAKKQLSERPKNFQFRFGDINQEVMENNLANGRHKELAYLVSLNTGKRIESYRNYWKEKINAMPKDEKEIVINGILDILVSNTDIDIKTLSERTDVESEEELLEKRRELWKKRIENFLA